jgi:glycosyltransferase involved in cell wall biosynthesis
MPRPSDPVIPGVRVVLDARPLQDPDRAPTTAAILGSLLAAYDAEPLDDESFAFLLRSDRDDPTTDLTGLEVIGRRMLPPTGPLRAAAPTVDPWLLRGASLGAAWRADRGGAHGAVYHSVGAGVLPIASGLPIVVTLLDLAPWELPDAFRGGGLARFGSRLRRRLLHDAAAVIVGTDAVARSARRHLRLPVGRVHVVPFAPRPAFVAAAADDASLDATEDATRLGLGPRYLVYPARYDARQDLGTLLSALDRLATAGRPAELPSEVAWPPQIVLVGASPDDRAGIARMAARHAAGSSLVYAQALTDERAAALARGARATLQPLVSDGVGLAAIESIAIGTPVLAAATGALPEIVGPAGVLVPPRDPDRLAVALRAVWTDDALHAALVTATRERAGVSARTWSDVARDTRRIYARVGVRQPPAAAGPSEVIGRSPDAESSR